MKRIRIQCMLPLACCDWRVVSVRASSAGSLAMALRLPRGGSQPYELNPDYIPPGKPLTLGDLENSPRGASHQQVYSYDGYGAESSKQRTGVAASALEQVIAFTTQLHNLSPTLSLGSASCILIWLLWQRQQAQAFLQNNFVCSKYNVRQGRHWTTVTSAVSHASFTHLLVNLFAFLSFGPPIVQTLSPWTLWPLVVGAAIFSSHVFLLMSKGGGCMGLSGVTLAFLAFVARLRPEQELGVLFMGIIPVRMPAQVALYALLAWSLIGSIVRRGRVAHSAHLGGLLFGMGYFELWIRRATVKRIQRLILRRGRTVVSGR